MNSKIMLWTCMLVLMLQLALALGIRPANTEIISEETHDYKDQFWVVNNDADSMKVSVAVEGEMAAYVTLNTSEITLREHDAAVPIDFEVHLPDFVPPGTSTANIVVQQQLDSYNPLVIASKIVLKHKILIQGPYPDKYVKVKLNFREDRNTVKLISEVENLGKKDLNEVKTIFYVNDQEQARHELKTEQVPLKRKENRLLTAEIERRYVELGEFEVLAVTQYDGEEQEMIQNMLVGKPEIDIIYFDKYFVVDKINEYTLDLLNRWNREIKNVFVDVEVKRNGQSADTFRTRSVDIEGSATERINDYYDTHGRERGSHTFEMVVNYWNNYRMDSKTFEIELVGEQEFESLSQKNAVPLTGKAVGEGGGASISFSAFIPWLIVAFLVGLIASYVIYRYTRREEYEGGDGAF